MPDYMIDVETLDNTPTSAILAIAAVRMDLGTLEVDEMNTFYQVNSAESAVSMGGTIGADTVLWWMKQSDEARAELTQERTMHLAGSLHQFAQFVCPDYAMINNVRIWGNGASFDNVILAGAFDRSRTKRPWVFWNDRCYRTMKNMNPEVPFIREGNHHNALADAMSQAKHLIAILKHQRQGQVSCPTA